MCNKNDFSKPRAISSFKKCNINKPELLFDLLSKLFFILKAKKGVKNTKMQHFIKWTLSDLYSILKVNQTTTLMKTA